MPPDPPIKRQKSHHEGDVERSRRTPRGGVPIVEIDPDVTPPPQQPPSMDGMTIEEKVDQLHSTLATTVLGVERVWRDRNLTEQVQTLIKDNAALMESLREFVIPSVKNMMGRLGTTEQSTGEYRIRLDRFLEVEWPAVMKTLEGLSTYCARIEKDVDRVERTMDGFVKRFDEINVSTTRRIDELKSTDDKQETRIRKLEDFQLSLKTKIALLSTLGGGLIAAAWKLIEHFM